MWARYTTATTLRLCVNAEVGSPCQARLLVKAAAAAPLSQIRHHIVLITTKSVDCGAGDYVSIEFSHLGICRAGSFSIDFKLARISSPCVSFLPDLGLTIFELLI